MRRAASSSRRQLGGISSPALICCPDNRKCGRKPTAPMELGLGTGQRAVGKSPQARKFGLDTYSKQTYDTDANAPCSTRGARRMLSDDA